jgi:16S rRNA (guanine966-N2)-methyltransferase
MRIIAGSAGGLRLDVPKNRVRPTMDRVKAAIFSSLGEAVIGARVLDLFAGSGALGLEALSRGAAWACFVERDRAAAATIEHNLAKTKLSGRVLQRDVFDFLRRPFTTEQFDIIFADPPYEKRENDEAFTALLLGNQKLAALLAPPGTFILEKPPSEKIPQTAWRIVRRKAYGATEVVFLQIFRSPVSGPPSRS